MAHTRVDTLTPAVQADTLSPGAVLGAGFPSADLLGPALSLIPEHRAGVSRPYRAHGLSDAGRLMLAGRTVTLQHEGPHGTLVLGPGTLQLIARDESRAERVRAHYRGPSIGSRDLGVTPWGLPGRSRARITSWSPKSRANMVRVLASADWAPFFRAGSGVMVTVTQPGPWHVFCPTRDVLAGYLEAMKERHRKAFGRVYGTWKVEYQGERPALVDWFDRHPERRRILSGGAPHVHLFLPRPPGVSLSSYRRWVRDNWHAVVFCQASRERVERVALVLGFDADAFWNLHESRHAQAGANVDWRKGASMRDPRRLAVYFLGHSLKHADGKEYQHVLPPSFAGRAGRWWGIWGVKVTTASREVDSDTWYAVRRLLRRWGKANRRGVFRGGAMHGGWVAVNDGPAFASAVARALDERQRVPRRSNWGRPLHPPRLP